MHLQPPFRDLTLDSPGVVETLRELFASARGVRGAMPLDHPARKAGETLSALLAHLHANGHSLSSLDRAMGSKIGVTRNRLARHGHVKASPSQDRVRYRGVKASGRPPRIDLTGQRFYKLTAVRPTGETTPAGPLWLFRCDCGNERTASAAQVRAGRVKACSTCPRVSNRGVRVERDPGPGDRYAR